MTAMRRLTAAQRALVEARKPDHHLRRIGGGWFLLRQAAADDADGYPRGWLVLAVVDVTTRGTGHVWLQQVVQGCRTRRDAVQAAAALH